MMLPGCSLLEIKVTAPPKAKSMPIRTSPLSRNVSLGAGIGACPPKVLRAQRAIAKQRQDSLLWMGLVFINCFVLVVHTLPSGHHPPFWRWRRAGESVFIHRKRPFFHLHAQNSYATETRLVCGPCLPESSHGWRPTA